MRAGARHALVLSWLAAACGSDAPPDGPPWTVRDSAGVTLVENAAPSLPAGSWTLSPDPLVVVGRPSDTAVDDPDRVPVRLGAPVDVRLTSGGGLLVADGGPGGWQIVFVFDPEGRPGAECGGAGDAPGAFERLGWAVAWPGDSIAAYDAAARTLTVFDTVDVRPGRECDVGRETPLPGRAYGVLADGSLLLDTLAELAGAPGRVDPVPDEEPFASRPSVAPAGEGFARAPGRPFEVRLHDSGGRLERIVRRTWRPDSVTVADRERYVRWWAGRAVTGPGAPSRAQRERLLRELPWPETLPAVSDVQVAGDGSVWLEAWRWHGREVPPDPRRTVWSVFSPAGRWVTDVEVPAGFVLTDATRDRVAGFHVDPSGGREVRVYELRRRGGF